MGGERICTQFMGDAVELHFVLGDHNTMIKAPHVQVLAQQLREALERDR